jgi:hypothetical protein
VSSCEDEGSTTRGRHVAKHWFREVHATPLYGEEGERGEKEKARALNELNSRRELDAFGRFLIKCHLGT